MGIIGALIGAGRARGCGWVTAGSWCYWKQVLGHSVAEDIIGVGPELLGTGVGPLGGKGTTLLEYRDWVIRDKLSEHGGYICTAVR